MKVIDLSVRIENKLSGPIEWASKDTTTFPSKIRSSTRYFKLIDKCEQKILKGEKKKKKVLGIQSLLKYLQRKMNRNCFEG